MRGDAEAGAFLEGGVIADLDPGPIAAPDPAVISSVEAGEIIGRYRILHEIGRGGMGTVFAAERDDDAFDRKVAVKVITAGTENDEVVRRLTAERQILALLEHPYIARVYDGGATADGLPYFAMELVDGQPIDDHCETHGLTIEQRVALVAKVCTAVEYAHRNLIVPSRSQAFQYPGDDRRRPQAGGFRHRQGSGIRNPRWPVAGEK